MNRSELAAADESETGGRSLKSAAAFRTTSEVAQELDLPAHVLRFWESKFPQVKPLKRGGGRRYYRPEDVDLLRRIRQSLYQQGYTIRGVQKLLREGALRGDNLDPRRFEAEAPAALSTPDPSSDLPKKAVTSHALRKALQDLRRDLLGIQSLLGKLGLTTEQERS